MPSPTKKTPAAAPRKVGRPETGNTRTKVSITVPIQLAALASKMASEKGESLSQFVSRAIQNLTLES